ncbi:hypothetical protein BT67DRAFT_436943 [Trichocladium antarcticum]|uniref:Uncharacterized protein n=1 Tax=Trichocladium antarcticum TaxID=1450529 RepID=A0AAN6UD20_9PEZI|nr:hypothetical protein BT67DRAFT_436943 [Trichocladium antarcticum]
MFSDLKLARDCGSASPSKVVVWYSLPPGLDQRMLELAPGGRIGWCKNGKAQLQEREGTTEECGGSSLVGHQLDLVWSQHDPNFTLQDCNNSSDPPATSICFQPLVHWSRFSAHKLNPSQDLFCRLSILTSRNLAFLVNKSSPATRRTTYEDHTVTFFDSTFIYLVVVSLQYATIFSIYALETQFPLLHQITLDQASSADCLKKSEIKMIFNTILAAAATVAHFGMTAAAVNGAARGDGPNATALAMRDVSDMTIVTQTITEQATVTVTLADAGITACETVTETIGSISSSSTITETIPETSSYPLTTETSTSTITSTSTYTDGTDIVTTTIVTVPTDPETSLTSPSVSWTTPFPSTSTTVSPSESESSTPTATTSAIIANVGAGMTKANLLNGLLLGGAVALAMVMG